MIWKFLIICEPDHDARVLEGGTNALSHILFPTFAITSWITAVCWRNTDILLATVSEFLPKLVDHLSCIDDDDDDRCGHSSINNDDAEFLATYAEEQFLHPIHRSICLSEVLALRWR